jgi:hypothetical protein
VRAQLLRMFRYRKGMVLAVYRRKEGHEC